MLAQRRILRLEMQHFMRGFGSSSRYRSGVFLVRFFRDGDLMRLAVDQG